MIIEEDSAVFEPDESAIVDLLSGTEPVANTIAEFVERLSHMKYETESEQLFMHHLFCTAIMAGKVGMVEYILRKGVDINVEHTGYTAPSFTGFTGLGIAIYHGCPATLSLLLRWRANTDKLMQGKSALELAQERLVLVTGMADGVYSSTLSAEALQYAVQAYQKIVKDLTGRLECEQLPLEEMSIGAFTVERLSEDIPKLEDYDALDAHYNSQPVRPNTIFSNANTLRTIRYMIKEDNPKEPTKVPMPRNVPKQCFDPIEGSNTSVGTDKATFYITDASGKILSASCLDEDSLQRYKVSDDYVFFRCKDTVPMSALSLSFDDVHRGALRLLNFAQRVYVRHSHAWSLTVGKKYILTPVEALGRVVSYNVLIGGSVVSAAHCGPADGSQLYEVKEIVEHTGGRRRTYRKRRAATRRARTIRRK